MIDLTGYGFKVEGRMPAIEKQVVLDDAWFDSLLGQHKSKRYDTTKGEYDYRDCFVEVSVSVDDEGDFPKRGLVVFASSTLQARVYVHGHVVGLVRSVEGSAASISSMIKRLTDDLCDDTLRFKAAIIAHKFLIAGKRAVLKESDDRIGFETSEFKVKIMPGPGCYKLTFINKTTEKLDTLVVSTDEDFGNALKLLLGGFYKKAT